MTFVLPSLFKVSHECLQALANGVLSFEVIRMIEQPQPHSMHNPKMKHFAAWDAVINLEESGADLSLTGTSTSL